MTAAVIRIAGGALIAAGLDLLVDVPLLQHFVAAVAILVGVALIAEASHR